MAQTDSEARQQLLDGLGQATGDLAEALALLGEAYEHLDDQQAERLEEELFRPVQRAYGRARRTYSDFATRHGLAEERWGEPATPSPSIGVKGFIEGAVDAVGRVDTELAGLQDSMMPIEFGDPELRRGLADVRRAIDGLTLRARTFTRMFGR